MPPTASSRPAGTGATPTEFFIVGCPRSGTTLLRWMLDAHALIAVTPETHFGERYLYRGRRGRFGGLDGDGSAHSALLDDFCGSPGFRRMGIDEAAFRIAAQADPRDAWLPLRASMHAFARLRKAKIVGEKTPGHALHLDALAKAFPAARFLFLRRDPRAVAASWVRTTWSTETEIQVAEKWRRYSKSMCDAYRALPGRCLELRYEELVSKPEDLLNSVCAFLGIEFDPRMLLYYERDHELDAEVLAPEEGVDNTMTFAAPDPSRIDAWRAELADREIRRIEAVCGRSMVDSGYERDTSIGQRIPSSIAVLPAVWRKRAKRKLRALRTKSV